MADTLREFPGKEDCFGPAEPDDRIEPAINLRTHFEEAWSAHESRGRQYLQLRLEELLGAGQLRSDGEFLVRRFSQISVGQAQRVTIALALLHRPDILIADEPTSALDPVTQAEIVRLMKRLNRSCGTALLYISHDLVSVHQI